MDKQQAVNYWLTNAEEKWKTTQSLFDAKRYADSLFFCHLTLECLLKALLSQTGEIPPPIHNLVRLSELA